MKPRPRVVVSRCLGFAACRYDGARLKDGFVQALRTHVRFIQVCPEVEIGMGVPRDPVRLVGRKMIQPSTGRDFTSKMTRFSSAFTRGLSDVDGFILKSRSPSCGIRDTKIHPTPIRRSSGLFGAAVLRAFPHAAIEDERRLADPRHREHWLVRLFVRTRFRMARKKETTRALAAFHREHEPLLLCHHRSATRALGKIVRDGKGFESYEEELGRALRRPPRERLPFLPYPRDSRLREPASR